MHEISNFDWGGGVKQHLKQSVIVIIVIDFIAIYYMFQKLLIIVTSKQ